MANREYGNCPAWYEHEDLAELKARIREALSKTQCSHFDRPICTNSTRPESSWCWHCLARRAIGGEHG